MYYYRFQSVHAAAEARKACGVQCVQLGLMLVCETEPRNKLAKQSSTLIDDDQKAQLDKAYRAAYPEPVEVVDHLTVEVEPVEVEEAFANPDEFDFGDPEEIESPESD